MILQNYYNNFSSVADNIANWRSLSKNELLNLYLEHEHDKNLKESYISAILCRYWGAINKYYKSSKNSASVEECFEWLTHAIMYALEHRKWKDPNSKLFDDPSGPDKVVNRCIASTRNIFYQANNNDNRKINFGLESIQRLQDDNLSYVLPSVDGFDTDCVNNIFFKDLVKEKFDNGKYIQGLIIDGILNANVFEKDKESNTIQFSKKKLAKHLRSFDDRTIDIISVNYKIDREIISEISAEMKKMLGTKLYKIIDYTLVGLSKVFKQNDLEM